MNPYTSQPHQDASSHPEFEIEQSQLTRTLAAIDARLENAVGLNTEGPDDWSTQALRAHFQSKHHDLLAAQESPYFGRVDFRVNSRQESFYIGRYGFQDGTIRIISWNAPIASLFYKGAPGLSSYRSPDGPIAGLLQLKRNISVQNRVLWRIVDEFDLRGEVESPSAEVVRLAKTEAAQQQVGYLRTKLEEPRTPKLRDIVETIQPEQYDLISADPFQILVVQGVAGSGKTSIALHRLVHLLHPEFGTGRNFNKCIVFGPTRLFLSYVANVLPGLGIQGIPHTTVADWAKGEIGFSEKESRDSILISILSSSVPREQKDRHWKRGQAMNSLKMGELLERYVERRMKQVRIPKGGLLLRKVGSLAVNLKLARAGLESAFDRFNKEPPSKRRWKFIDFVTEMLAAQYQTIRRAKALKITAWLSSDQEEEIEKGKGSVWRDIRRLVEKEVNQWWPTLRLLDEFYALLGDKKLLSELGRTLFDSATLEILHRLEKPHKDSIDLTDLAALQYLYLLWNGEPGSGRKFDHIVVDEAQDVSPLQFAVLKQYSRNQSMTILGDLPQGIFAYRGLSSWETLREVFGDSRLTYSEIRRSYRTTFEIIKFANNIIQHLTKHGRTLMIAEPFDRHGLTPELHQVSGDSELAQLLGSVVSREQKAGLQNIAIVGKTSPRCKAIAENLRQIIPNVFLAEISTVEYKGGVIILPAHLAKGLEFEAALVVDADQDDYADREWDSRLLYVALTRALHKLYVFWSGEIAPCLEEAIRLRNI